MVETFNMGISTTIIEAIFLIIITLIVIIIILTYFLNLRIKSRQKKIKKTSGEIENYFKNLIESKKPFNSNSFSSDWRKLRAVYPTFVKVDNHHQENPYWQENRNTLIQSLLLPLARKNTKSKRWIKRFYVGEIFSMVGSKEDEKTIIKFTQDKIPLVFFHSIAAAIKIESEIAINNIINRVQKIGWASQLLYLEPFKNASPAVREFVIKRLKNEENTKVRTVCYKILLKMPPAQLKVEHNDLYSNDFELRLAALRYTIYINKDESLPIIVEKLKDPHWEVRLVALHRLGAMKMESLLPTIAECLNDTNWWVRLSAAEALKSLGPKGQEVLEAQAPDLASMPFDASDHIHHSMW